MRTLDYHRARFRTELPAGHLYTASHYWLAKSPINEKIWRVGYTKLALRFLGEVVDVQLKATGCQPIHAGDILGTIEGFKAINDIASVGEGSFEAANPALAEGVGLVTTSPYEQGWLYAFQGSPGAGALDVQEYSKVLDTVIDRMLLKQSESEDL